MYVSNHALVRFIERAKGETLSRYRDECGALTEKSLIDYIEKEKKISLDSYRDEIRKLVRERMSEQTKIYAGGLAFIVASPARTPAVVTTLIRIPAQGRSERLQDFDRVVVHIPDEVAASLRERVMA